MGGVKYVSQNFICSALSDVKIWHSGKQYLDLFTICLKNLLPTTADDSIHLTQCDWYGYIRHIVPIVINAVML